MAEEAKWYVVHTYSGYENAVAAAVMAALPAVTFRTNIGVNT